MEKYKNSQNKSWLFSALIGLGLVRGEGPVDECANEGGGADGGDPEKDATEAREPAAELVAVVFMDGGAELGGGLGVGLQRAAEDASDSIDRDDLRVHTSREGAGEALIGFKAFLKAREALFKVGDLRIFFQQGATKHNNILVRNLRCRWNGFIDDLCC